MDHLLPNVLPLLRKFQDQVKSILHILEILLVIDYRDAYLSQFRQVMFEILHEFKAIFRNINNQDLLNSISKLYGLVSDDLSPFGEPFIKFVTIVKESTIQELKNFIESNRDRTLSTEDNLKIELCYLKLSCLFIHHDLSPYLNSNVLLNDVLPASKSFSVKTTKYGISCCFSYITWMLNIFIDILNEANFEEELVGPVELKSMTDNYVKACFQFIKETNHILIRTEAFNNIHKIYIRFHKELQPLIKIDKNLKKCLPVPFTSTETNDFMICAQIILFEDNDDDTYLARRQTLNWVLSMFSLKVMNLPELVKIYKYYHSHFACYGDLLDVYLQDLRNISSVAVSAFVMKNVLYCYLNNILNLRAEQLEVADIELKKLTKQFQVFMSKHPEELKLSLKFGFQYAIAAENRLKILSYVKYFVNSLPLQEKKEIFELVEEKVPNEFRNHVLILEFISYFKTKQSLNVNASASNAETESEEEADTTTIENFTSDEQTVPDRTDENIIEEYASD